MSWLKHSEQPKKPRRRMLRQAERLSVIQVTGAVILFIGLAMLIGVGVYELLTHVFKKPMTDGAILVTDLSSFVAVGFLMVMLGMAFLFPSMLEAKQKNHTSSMRVIAYMITCVFVFLCAKIGWNCHDFKSFTLDSTWAYLLAAAMGSKALQSFSENRAQNTLPTFSSGAQPQLNPTRTNSGPDATNLPNKGSLLTQLGASPQDLPKLVLKKMTS